MRYTTIIDITTIRDVYKNVNARLVYLHMVLKSGYHDDDRDLLRISLRSLAADVGITISAARHALAVLTKSTLVYQKDGTWHVRKFIIDQPITPRAKTKNAQRDAAIAAKRDNDNEQRERELEMQRENRRRLRAAGKTSWMVFYERKQELAAHGDAEAAAYVAKYAAQYKQQTEEMKKQ